MQHPADKQRIREQIQVIRSAQQDKGVMEISAQLLAQLWSQNHSDVQGSDAQEVRIAAHVAARDIAQEIINEGRKPSTLRQRERAGQQVIEGCEICTVYHEVLRDGEWRDVHEKDMTDEEWIDAYEEHRSKEREHRRLKSQYAESADFHGKFAREMKRYRPQAWKAVG